MSLKRRRTDCDESAIKGSPSKKTKTQMMNPEEESEIDLDCDFSLHQEETVLAPEAAQPPPPIKSQPESPMVKKDSPSCISRLQLSPLDDKTKNILLDQKNQSSDQIATFSHVINTVRFLYTEERLGELAMKELKGPLGCYLNYWCSRNLVSNTLRQSETRQEAKHNAYAARAILFEWMFDIAICYKICRSILYLAFSIVDTFMSRMYHSEASLVTSISSSSSSSTSSAPLFINSFSSNQVYDTIHISSQNYQLVGYVSLVLARKLVDDTMYNKDWECLDLSYCHEITDRTFTLAQAIAMEAFMMTTMDWKFPKQSLISWLYDHLFALAHHCLTTPDSGVLSDERVMLAKQVLDKKLFIEATKQMDYIILDLEYFDHLPCMIALSIVRKIHNKHEVWCDWYRNNVLLLPRSGASGSPSESPKTKYVEFRIYENNERLDKLRREKQKEKEKEEEFAQFRNRFPSLEQHIPPHPMEFLSQT